MGPAERKALFDRAKLLSTQRHDWPAAEAAWVEAIGAYRVSVREASRPDRDDQRQLARALWRHSMLLAAMGRAASGVAPGQQAVALFQQLHDVAAKEGGDVTAPHRDEALAELITAMIDLSEVAFAAGDAEERVALLDRALGAGLSVVPPPQAGQRTREAMATGYHNYAVALYLRRSDHDGDQQEAALAGSRAFQLRQEMLDPARPISLWELANTCVVYAQCLALIGERGRARTTLELGDKLADVIGPAAGDIGAKLRAAREVVDAAPRRRWWSRRR